MDAATNIPSGLKSRQAFSAAQASSSAPFQGSAAAFPAQKPHPVSSGGSSLPLIISFLALIIAFAALFVAFTIPSPISPDQKAQLKEISNALRTLQSKDITMTTPIRTTVYIDKSFPLQDIFPASFSLPISFNIPVNTQLVGVSSSGQPVIFKVSDTIPVVANVPIDSEKTFGNSYITIKKEIPIESRFNAAVNIRAAYGSELNTIIDKLDAMSK
ncbi:Uncharacterised protein [Candidatus Anstonella stagnisolia]|nr:Uncharacterised protein [Candidatus Anstonella stagnisolia]